MRLSLKGYFHLIASYADASLVLFHSLILTLRMQAVSCTIRGALLLGLSIILHPLAKRVKVECLLIVPDLYSAGTDFEQQQQVIHDLTLLMVALSIFNG